TSSLVAIGSRGNGFNKQIFDADEQVPGRGQSDKEGFGPTVSPQLVQSGKGRIASDPALFNLSRPLMVGAFSVHGSDEQMLAQNNKTRTRAKATQKRAALQSTQRNRSQQMKTYGNLLLMSAICIVIFWIFMALRPAQAAGRIGMWLPPAQYDGLHTGELTIRRV